MTEKIPCRTPEGKSATNIPTWKFDACRAAILAELNGQEVPAKEISTRAGARLTEEQRAELGSLGWHIIAVRLEMEVRGEVERVPGAKPIRLRLPK